MRRPGGSALIAWCGGLAALALHPSSGQAQELEPRSYAPAPIGATIVIAGYGRSSGEMLFDVAAPVSDAHATINAVTAGASHVFEVGGKQTNLTLVAPYLWGDANGDVGSETREITRSGLGDVRLKLSVLLAGGAPLTAARREKPVVGVSLAVIAPTGEYDSAKLINIGSNRWAFKPEVGVSYPKGPWQMDAYAGVWLFTDNNDFLGGRTRAQDPIGSFQAHLSYTFRPGLWAAVNATYFRGGSTEVEGVRAHDRQDNLRLGLTLSAPITPRQSIRLSYGQSAVTRIGSNFTSFTISWQGVLPP